MRGLGPSDTTSGMAVVLGTSAPAVTPSPSAMTMPLSTFSSKALVTSPSVSPAAVSSLRGGLEGLADQVGRDRHRRRAGRHQDLELAALGDGGAGRRVLQQDLAGHGAVLGDRALGDGEAVAVAADRGRDGGVEVGHVGADQRRGHVGGDADLAVPVARAADADGGEQQQDQHDDGPPAAGPAHLAVGVAGAVLAGVVVTGRRRGQPGEGAGGDGLVGLPLAATALTARQRLVAVRRRRRRRRSRPAACRG